MELRIDRRIYSDNCITKAIYSLSKDYVINRDMIGDDSEMLQVVPISLMNTDERYIQQTILSTLNDYKLRQLIEEETHDIRLILYAKAFAEFEDIDEEDV